MSQDARKTIAKKIKELRLLANLKREELSLALGFDNSYISKLERVKINITIDILEKISNFFHTPLRDFFI